MYLRGHPWLPLSPEKAHLAKHAVLDRISDTLTVFELYKAAERACAQARLGEDTVYSLAVRCLARKPGDFRGPPFIPR
jgi:hypothetical protein